MIYPKNIPDNTPLIIGASLGPVSLQEELIWGNTQLDTITAFGGRINVLNVEAPGSVPQEDGTYALDLTAVSTAETRTFTTDEGQQVTMNIEAPAQAAKWSDGIYYMLEVDPTTEELLFEPGRNHRKVYATNGPHGYTKAEIAAEVGLAESAITTNWLRDSLVYGRSPEKALMEAVAMPLWENLTRNTTGIKKQSHWLLLERGYRYGSTGVHWWQPNAEGESLLHPMLLGFYGTGPDPVLDTGIITYDCKKVAAVGLVTTQSTRILYGEDMIISDTAPHPEANENSFTTGRGAVTLYRVLIADSHRLVPGGSNPEIWASHASRTQGIYVSDSKSVLLQDTMVDHNGWKDGYHPTSPYVIDSASQPPSMYSQNIYVHDGIKDVTIDGCLTSRPASQGIQLRCGGTISNTVFLDNQGSGNDLGGDYSDKGPVGHWGLFLRNIITSASYLPEPDGVGPKGAKNWGFTFQNALGSAVDSIVCHMSNPNDPDEVAFKDKRKFAIRNISQRGYLFNNTVSYNWDTFNENVQGLDPATLNARTIQNFAATKLPGGTAPTIKNLLNWMKTLRPRQRQVLIREMQDYFRAAYDAKLEMSAVRRTAAATCVFKPDYRGEGFRWDNELNWSTKDRAGIVAGDSADLHGNFVRYGRFTLTVASLEFGGGRLDVTSGKLTAQAHADAANVTVRNSGQYFAPANAHGDYIAAGGRLAFIGAASVDLEVAGEAECLLGPDLTIPVGKELTLTGGDLWAGWDRTGNATLTVEGTLSFNAVEGKIGKLQRFKRRGDDPEPTVAVTVTLEAGSSVVVDTDTLVPGTYDLTGTGVTVVNQGATLPTGVTVTGGKLVYTQV